MDRHCVAHAAVAQDLLAALAALTPVLDYIEGEDRAALLDPPRVVATNAAQGRHEDARACWDGDAAFFRNDHGRLPNERGIWQALRRHEHARERLHFARVHEVAAL